MTALDKKKVAASFGRAAESYDDAAQLQRDIGSDLMLQLPVDIAPKVIVDLGSGTGYFSKKLQERFPDAHIICLDLAEGMLNFSRRQRNVCADYICADAESLPLQSQSVDLIFSSLAIQWCENYSLVFKELQRVLRPSGVALIATLGPKTLQELRSAWRQVDDYVHVNQFVSAEKIDESLVSAKFSQAHTSIAERVFKYATLQQITRELKAIGAHNVNHGKSQGLSGRARIEKFRAAYESFRRDGYLPATYEVFYLSLIK